MAVRRRAGRSRDSEATRAALLDAAEALFARQGYDGTTVEAIARRAGVNKAMVSYHFGGKRALYLTMLDGAYSKLTVALGAVLETEQDAEAGLRAFVAAFAAAVEARPALPRVVLREMLAGGRQAGDQLLPHFLSVLAVTRQLLDRGVQEGRFRQASPFPVHLTLIGALVLYFVTEPMRQRMARSGRVPFAVPTTDDFVAQLQDLVTRGLAAAPVTNRS